MRSTTILILAVVVTLGCGREHEIEVAMPFDQVPASILKVAEAKLPDVKFDSAYREMKDGKEVYELRGKTKEGKIRDVEVTSDGKILEVD